MPSAMCMTTEIPFSVLQIKRPVSRETENVKENNIYYSDFAWLMCSSSHSHTLAWHKKIQAVQQEGTQPVDDLAESLKKGPLIRWLTPTKWI